jgi:hypothetical protein
MLRRGLNSRDQNKKNEEQYYSIHDVFVSANVAIRAKRVL